MSSSITTTRVLLASRPNGAVQDTDFKIDTQPLDQDLKDGEVLFKVEYLSVDPYLRYRFNQIPLNQPIESFGIGSVVQSKNPNFPEKELVNAHFPWQQYAKLSSDQLKQAIKVGQFNVPPQHFLSVAGLTGLTAYFGLLHVGSPKEGETVVVSGAAGATGNMVGQIAKIKGCRVIGIAGSDEKVKYLKEELGFDEVINYKTVPDLEKAIKAAALDKGVDVYFDNVGGSISDAVIANINIGARIPVCGQISLYNNADLLNAPGLRREPVLLWKQARMEGFLVLKFQNQFEAAIPQLLKWLAEGSLKDRFTQKNGIESLPSAFIDMMKGDNIGKMLVKL